MGGEQIMLASQQPLRRCWECLLRSASEGHNDPLRACVAGPVCTFGGQTSGKTTDKVAQDAQPERVSVDAARAGRRRWTRPAAPGGPVAPGARLSEPPAVRRSAYGAYALQSGMLGIAPLHEMPAMQL